MWEGKEGGRDEGRVKEVCYDVRCVYDGNGKKGKGKK